MSSMINVEKASLNLGEISKPATKLVEAIASAIGTVYEPTRKRRDARAEADAKLIAAQGEIDLADLRERAGLRQQHVEIRRQNNLELIEAKAIAMLPSAVSEEPVDPDWVFTFTEECKDTSNDDIQTLWARILAKEVEAPGSCSRRALRIVKLMERYDAALFSTLASLVFTCANLTFAILLKDGLQSYEVDEGGLAQLADLGLVLQQTAFQRQLGIARGISLKYFGAEYSVLELPEGKQQVAVPFLCFTRCGAELLHVCTPAANAAYRDAVLALLRDEYKLTISLRSASPI